jgi:hypothetical protein
VPLRGGVPFLRKMNDELAEEMNENEKKKTETKAKKKAETETKAKAATETKTEAKAKATPATTSTATPPPAAAASSSSSMFASLTAGGAGSLPKTVRLYDVSGTPLAALLIKKHWEQKHPRQAERLAAGEVLTLEDLTAEEAAEDDGASGGKVVEKLRFWQRCTLGGLAVVGLYMLHAPYTLNPKP